MSFDKLKAAVSAAIERNGLRGPDGLGNCFPIAAEAFIYADLPQARLVHGQAQYGKYYTPHAWVVLGDRVIDLKGTYTAAEWNTARKPKDCCEYTVQHAMDNVLRHNSYGPWTEALLANYIVE